ncbi:PQQ-dependent dehydrogenase (s-GDH family) [Larkinella arboricola]|uniref:PQQ-dependent dehydrogenase (S-GDH family) n=2 Tax=Larkinella arboricola TaxID=643671 RepID=A0A327WQ96_LARAB|nr:PQQ-dependent dehydrogenase (s-GDH family) [Larkinella arboricola]
MTGPQGERFSVRIVKDRLSDPWEVTYGPDRFLWITEAKGYRVSRINPTTGARTVLLDLSQNRNFPRYDQIPDSVDGGKPWPQGGLMGLALHPQLLTGKPYVYLAYVHTHEAANQPGSGRAPNYGGHFFRARLVRYEYDVRRQSLGKPRVLCDTIAASNDHNSGRLLIAPVEGRPYLFYSVGDLGAGQFENAGRPNHAQDRTVYEGKILRFNLEPDQDAQPDEQWIPNDNPFNAQRQNAVWSYGHRNVQGLAYATVAGSGRLYTAEHGPFSDDEINIIEKGRNYGHPLIIGYADDNYNGLAAGVSHHDSLPGIWHTTYPTIGSESENRRRIGDAYRDPIKSMYPLSAHYLQNLFAKTRANAPDKPDWPAEAPSSLIVYTASAIPNWQNSLLLTTLKTGRLVRLALDSAGTGIQGDTLGYFKLPIRYRDIALSADGRKIYLAVDSSITTSGPSQEDPRTTSYRGCILEFTYLPDGQSANGVMPKEAFPPGRARRKKE